MTFLTAGTTELSLQTANLYVLYGLLAIASAGAPPLAPESATQDAAS
jgi:hypothetical protein